MIKEKEEMEINIGLNRIHSQMSSSWQQRIEIDMQNILISL